MINWFLSLRKWPLFLKRIPARITKTSGIGSLPLKRTICYLCETVDHNRNESWRNSCIRIKRSGKTERRNGKVKTQVGFEGTLLEFFDYVRNKPEKPFTKPEEVIANFERIHAIIKPNVDKLFSPAKNKVWDQKNRGFREKRRVQNTVKEQQMDLALVCFMFQYQI
jgi:hypothetical protein